MRSIRSLLGTGGRLLAHHLDRLRQTLDALGGRLRDAVSSAVGETVAGVVRETVRAVLADPPFSPAPDGHFRQTHSPSRPPWARPEDTDDNPWFEEPDRYPPGEYSLDEAPSRADPPRDVARLSRWPRALAVGLQATLCWLRRRVGRFPVRTALAVGLLTALATFAGGPLAAAGVSMAGSAFSLLSLAEAVHAGADTLADLGSP